MPVCEKKLLSYPEVENVYTRVGSKGGSISIVETPYGAEFNIKLVPKDKRELSSKLFSKKLQNDLASYFPGPKFKVSEISMAGSTTTPIEIYVRGVDFEKAKVYSQIVVNELRQLKELPI
jgi:multidrug efflux pump subunit AcrB